MYHVDLVDAILQEVEEASRYNWAEYIVRTDLEKLIRKHDDLLKEHIRAEVERVKLESNWVNVDDILDLLY